jgi:uncharacterized protein YbjT (DUF2867 family)
LAVLVLGGYGLIGSAIVDRLKGEGFAVIGCGRHAAAARRKRPDVDWREADLAKLTTPAAWTQLLRDVEVVVHAAGALQQGPQDNVRAVQEHAVRALTAAAGPAGVRLIVLISAAGATVTSNTAFMRTKAAAEQALAQGTTPFVVLRPGLVIAPVAYGGTALLRGLAAFPKITPLVFAGSRVRTVGLEDVAQATLAAVSGAIPPGSVLDLVEQPARDLAQTVAVLRSWLALPPARTVMLKPWAAAAAAAGADLLGWLGWRSPLRSTAMTVMAGGVDGDPAHAAAALGRPARSLTQVLGRMPAGVQEQWFARLWLLKPAIIGLLAVFWIASGWIGLARQADAMAVLTDRWLPAAFARPAVVWGAWLDVVLGVAVLVRPLCALALKGMVAASLAYMAGSLVLAPDLWLNPLGAMLKTTCCLMLAVVALAVLDER